jgi:hypothetical protein
VSRTQLGVALGMTAALVATWLLVSYGISGAPGLPLVHSAAFADRMTLAVAAWLGPLVSLTVAIGAVANGRFFSDADIDGAGLTAESPRIRIRRAVLVNTAEQTLLAVPVYAAMAALLPARSLPAPLLLSAAFVLGRLTFAIGYRYGAAARSFGFALTFYPTVAGLILVVWRLAASI